MAKQQTKGFNMIFHEFLTENQMALKMKKLANK